MSKYPVLDNVISELELDKDSSLKYYEEKDSWVGKVPYRTKHVLDVLKPYAFYTFNDQPYVLFFKNLKSAEEKEKVHKAIWNFQKSPVIIFDEGNELRIYNGFSLKEDKTSLKNIPNAELSDFNFWNFHSGVVWEKFESQFNKKRLDDYLLSNISGAIDLLTQGLKSIQSDHKREIANNLVGRLIFSRYLIDRKVELSSEFIEVGNERESFINLIADRERLYAFFAYLKDKFHGNLFPLVEDEPDVVTNYHLNVLQELFRGSNVTSGQQSLFDIYDFNIIPIELVSNIYERFIGKDNQNRNKSFYTPPFLVDYVLSKTVRRLLDKDSKTCKVLDPSCGSGIFLVETLRSIIESRLKQNGGTISDDDLRAIVKENIHGIDKDENAINVAIFSLYITLLDYKNPREIETFTLPELKGGNFVVQDFFNKKVDTALEGIEFDFILGNPPWGNVKGLHNEYCASEGIPIHRNEIARSFLARVKDFSSKNTESVLIVTSKILYNASREAKAFRLNYFLKNFSINEVLELSPVRHQIFSNAIGPAAILFYKYTPQENVFKNVVNHISPKPNRFFSLFKTIVIEKFDHKKISQKFFIENDWIWKVMLYGNTLDYRFIKRLKECYPESINDKIEEENFSTAVGVQVVKTGDKNDASHLIGKRFLNTNKNMLQRFYAASSENELWTEGVVHRPRTPEVFNAPYALIKKGISTDFKLVAAYSEEDMVFTDSVTAINGTPEKSNTLKEIVGLLSSELFSYFIFATGSSTGIEREQVHKDEKFAFPFVSDERLVKTVDFLQHLQKDKYAILFDGKKEDALKVEEARLDNILNELFDLSNAEKELIDYTVNVSIPLFQKSSKPFLQIGERELMDYASVFVEHFSKRFDTESEKFLANIYIGEFYHSIHFTIEETKGELNERVKCVEMDNKDLFTLLTRFSVEQITQDLFLQKDIKGFEENSFYIIKPNEYKNWHPALARLDLAEFMEALLMKKN